MIIIYYYDSVIFNDYEFYIVVKDEIIYSLGLEKPIGIDYVFNKDKLSPYTTWLTNYFNGNIKPHNFKFNLTGNEFRNKVYSELINIKPGDVKTYKYLASKINNPKASRAIGNALSKNEILILIPCHRIIKSDGSLGGFAEGLELKQLLLTIEEKATI